LLQSRNRRACFGGVRALDRIEDDQGFAEDADGAAGLAEVRIGIAEIASVLPSPRRSPISRAITRCCS
jgi:hypothetical protein